MAPLKKNGVRVISAKENITDDASGIIVEGVLESMAEYYSAELSQKIRRGMDINAQKCLSNGSLPGLGFKVDADRKFYIDPEAAAVVREIYERYASGETVAEINRDLNARQIKTAHGKEFNKNSLHRILRNKRYIGVYLYKDMEIPGGMPRIIEDELFERVQHILNKNKQAPGRTRGKEEYLLTTKLFCGYCGKFMIGESGKSRNGTVHRYYKCTTIKNLKGDCKKKSVKKDWIEDLIIRRTIAMLNNDEVIDDIVKKLLALQEKDSSELPYYERELADTENSIDNLLNAIQQGILTKSTKERSEELESRKERLEILIAEEKMIKPKLSEEFIRFYLMKFRSLDMAKLAHRKILIETFVNSVYIFDDKLVITYNADEKTETVTLEEINGSIIECSGAP